MRALVLVLTLFLAAPANAAPPRDLMERAIVFVAGELGTPIPRARPIVIMTDGCGLQWAGKRWPCWTRFTRLRIVAAQRGEKLYFHRSWRFRTVEQQCVYAHEMAHWMRLKFGGQTSETEARRVERACVRAGGL